MTIHNLEKIFEPTAVAVIGASKKEGSMGSFLMGNLLNSGYEGKIFPVTDRYKSVRGVPAYGSISEIKKPIDLAVIATPMVEVPGLIRQCVEKRVAGAVIISAGGKEIGKSGEQLEAQIRHEASKSDLRIIGPNCVGIMDTGSSLNASLIDKMPLPGKLAFISQSGAICASILDFSLKQAIGFRYFVSIGSMLDVDFGDMINYLGNDPNVSSIVLYIESLINTRKFMSAARAVSRIKPIVVLKAGKTRAGARAASSHTGAMAGEDAVYSEAFKRAGIVRVKRIIELFDCAELMAKQPIPSGSSLAIITNGGGPGVMATDALAEYGIEPVSLSQETLKKLDEFLPSYWSRGNPIDILGDASPERWRKTIEVCRSANEINALVIIFVPQTLKNAVAVAKEIARLFRDKSHLPVFTVWMGGGEVEKGRKILNHAGIPTYETPERAISAFMYMYSYARNLEILQEIPPKLQRSLEYDYHAAKAVIEKAAREEGTLLTEMESKAVLTAYGIPVNRTEVAKSSEEAVKLAKKIGYPVAMKVLSRDIVHKSDAFAVKLNLRNGKDVREAFSKIMSSAPAYNPKAEIMGVTVQPMLRRPDYELILGSKLDKDFGPVILFGMGGIMTEILKDQAIALPPLNRLLARRLIESTRVFQILKGYRNRPAANLDLLEEILIRLSQLVTDFPEILELDVNPMILVEDRAFAVDARVLVQKASVTSPHHLVISPYPNEYEKIVTTKGGLRFFIRPIRPEDEPLMVELFQVLSPQTVYYRFFRPLKKISHKLMAPLTQIDYDRDIALVAIDYGHETEKILGAARIMTTPGGTNPEFAVLVGDPWQGMGVGAALMNHLLSIAKSRGLASISGLVMGTNKTMLALARKLGFGIKRVTGGSEFELNIDLRTFTMEG